MKVSINTPCHENWDAMEPDEKGAFCLSCQKSVVDFSNKTTNEIKSFFRSIADTEKVCGRFKEEQLTELTFDDFFSRFRKWILPRKIAVVMFFVFGLTLFSCQNTKHGHLMGDVAIEEPVIDHSSNNVEVMGKVAYIQDTPKVVKPVEKIGMVAIEPTTTQTVSPKQPVKIENYVKGDVDIERDPIKKPDCTKKDTLPEKHKMGKIKVGD